MTGVQTCALPISVTYTMFMVVVNPGTVSMVNGSVMHQVGVFNSQDVLNLEASGGPMVPYSEDKNVYGGAWYDSVGNFLRKARDFIKPVASPILDYIPNPVVQIGRKVVGLGGKKRKVVRRKKAGLLVGGDLMSRDMLHDRLMM